VGSIDEPPSIQNSRRTYQENSIRELAESLREDGFLQPLCVRPNRSRYEIVFGVRRFRAAKEAGLQEVPCTIRIADDDRAFLLNAVENLHRAQLSNAERVATIERLAATGLGVREISRRTGFNPSTISRWLRINGRPELKRALAEGRIDIARAVVLVEAPGAALRQLIEQSRTMSVVELRREVCALKRDPDGAPARSDERRYLTQALRCLRAVASTDDTDAVESLRRELDRLSQQK
jgi:ParB family chromosome partitioning protein